MEATINAYNPDWQPPFKRICSTLDVHLCQVPGTASSHIGSTSVPFLSGRSSVDILITVPREELEAAIIALTLSGKYEQSRGGQVTFGTVLSTLGDIHLYAHDLYVCESDSLAARAHIAVRDTLRKDKQLRDEYAAILTRALKAAEDADHKNEEQGSVFAQAKIEAMQEVIIASGQFDSSELATIFSSDCSARWAPICTPRTLIREFELADVDGMFALEGNEENARYQDWPPWSHVQARQNVLRETRKSYEKGRDVVELAVEYDGIFVGRIGGRVTSLSTAADEQKTMDADENDSVERKAKHFDLWYSFLSSCQGKGLATEATAAFIAQLVEKERVEHKSIELEIECDPRNTGSWKLAERLGFSKHSLTERAWESKGEWVDSLVYRKTM
ncbi:hypothetical protein N0V91_004970 [Didymella pomorum]|uniref:N-acetyltransferase domain-containing protein n=1 Tax=Didymella pomorum TaxID=749634 RepID=A0A9W8ZFZ6_9PLEO|nr:hypothetical protein N0V91_004970 [Didymella pomorum]